VVTRALAALFLALTAAPALAQSTDPAFAGQWTWSPETLAAEATGLGGAFVTTVRGAEALYWSPAGMTFDSGIDVRTFMGARPGLGVVYHGERLHLGVGVRRTFSRTQHGRGFDASSQTFESGQFAVMVDQAAVGAAVQSGRLRLGAMLAAGPMKTSGVWSRVAASPTPGAAATEVRYDYTGADEWLVGGATSALVELLGVHPMARSQARIGVAVRWPSMLRTPRYRRSRLLLPAFQAEGPDLQRFRLPQMISVGGEARLSVLSMMRSVRISIGADWTDYAGVLETARANGLEPGTSLAFDEDRAWIFGGGLEAVHTLGRLRVGVRERADHRLVTGPGPVGPKNPRLTFGASRDAVIAGKRLQLDIDSTSSFDDLVLSTRILW